MSRLNIATSAAILTGSSTGWHRRSTPAGDQLVAMLTPYAATTLLHFSATTRPSRRR